VARRGHSTSIGKFAKLHHAHRVSEIRVLGEQLRRERRAALMGVTLGATTPEKPVDTQPDD
jgi:predicted alpha/beta-fold hydrolase